jgi:hypothetical protein
MTVLLVTAHTDGLTVVHLTHTALVHEGICGEPVTHHGEPDLATICDDCLTFALALGEDVSVWYRVAEEPIELRIAA